MSGFKVRVLTAGPHVVNDLGITLDAAGAAPVTVDLTSLPPQNIARSTDLSALVSSSDIVIVDARDDTDSTFLSMADSLEAINNHNDTHFGISGGRFAAADDPTVTPGGDHILQYVSVTDTWQAFPPEHLFAGQNLTLGEIIGGMGKDGTDTTYVFSQGDTCLVGYSIQDETYYDGDSDFENGSFFGGTGGYAALDTITLSDGSIVTVDAVAAGVVTAFTVTTSGFTVVTTGVALTQSSTSGGGTGFTLTPEQRNVTPGKMQWDVDDVFLRNTGDTLDSGTLVIASGASVSFPAGSTLTIDSAVTTATIDTPGGGFTGDTDIINKAYVDQIAAGLDWKESVRVATQTGEDLTGGSFGGAYAPGGGPTGTGEFTGVDLSSATGGSIDGLNFTGSSATGLVVGDRVLVKNQGSATQNGIYEITAGPAASATLTRATDQDGSPASEVSGGNTTYVEDTTGINASSTNSDTSWSLSFDGIVTLNTDPVDWVQVSGPGSLIARIGLSRDGNTIDLDVDDLTAVTSGIDQAADTIAFHDADGTPNSSGSQTRKITFEDLFEDLDVVYDIGTGTGIVVKTGDSPDTYTTRTITVNGAGNLDGLAISNGDGVSANPIIGLDIQNLPARSTAIDTSDRVAVWRSDGTDANEYYTIGEIAGAVSASNSFETWSRAGNGTGAAVVADSATDTVTITGGIGIDIDTVPATDTITWTFSNSGMADTAVVGADTVPFFDAGNSDEPEFRSFTNIISDLGILTSVSASVDEDELGIVVTGGDTIGLDIVGLTDPNADMDATDEFAVHDKSEGTAGANRKITGQNIADGVADILDIATLTFDTFTAVNSPAEDQTLLAYTDSTRGSKVLSVEANTYAWADTQVDDNDWINIGNTDDADSGYIMPLDGTIVMCGAFTEDGKAATMAIDLYINGVDNGPVASLTGAGNASDSDPTLDINFSAGDRLRLRGDRTAGSGAIEDTVITLTVRWRS